ncbi:MAG: hypothetical protein ACFFAS_20300 [Promethearchaeota archaeon]
MRKDILKQWDDLADSIGTDRTSMIHNAVQIYELFLTNQLNGNKQESIIEQIEQVRILIEGMQHKEDQLLQEQHEIEETFNNIDIGDIEDFNIVSDRILELLQNWGSLQSDTISLHLKYPGWIVWTVLNKLKARKKVKVNNGEWMLF